MACTTKTQCLAPAHIPGRVQATSHAGSFRNMGDMVQGDFHITDGYLPGFGAACRSYRVPVRYHADLKEKKILENLTSWTGKGSSTKPERVSPSSLQSCR